MGGGGDRPTGCCVGSKKQPGPRVIRMGCIERRNYGSFTKGGWAKGARRKKRAKGSDSSNEEVGGL